MKKVRESNEDDLGYFAYIGNFNDNTNCQDNKINLNQFFKLMRL